MRATDVQLSDLVRRGIFVAAHLAVAAIFYFAAIEPVRLYLANREEKLADRLARLAQYEAIVIQERDVKAYQDAVTSGNARGELIAGDGDGIVHANLQARLQSYAEQAKVKVQLMQNLPARSIGRVTLVGARLTVSGPFEAVHSLTRRIESDMPLLLVMAATLNLRPTVWTATENIDQTLEAQFDVYGGAFAESARSGLGKVGPAE